MFVRFLFCFVALAVLIRLAAIAQGEPGPRVALQAQAHYLSTESAQASIDIDNTTDREIGYSPVSVIFLIRDAAGHRYEDRWVKVITRIPPVTWIMPGEHQSFGVTLPKCDALTDPCTERVAVKLGFYVKSGTAITVVTNERSYTFDPDPTATFRIDGLRNDKPLFIEQGEARDVVPQNRAVIELRFSGDDVPKDAESVVSAILKQRALTIVETGSNEARAQRFEVVTEGQGIQPPAAIDITAAITDVRRHYGARLDSVSSYYVPDIYFGFDRVNDEARREARIAAEALGTLVRATPLSDAYGLIGDSTQIQFMRRSDDEDQSTPFVSYQDVMFDDAVRARLQSKLPELLDVRVHQTQGFLGARPIKGSAPDLGTPAPSIEYLGDGLRDLAPLPLRAVIAADRPQVFAIAFLTLQESARLGSDPYALALMLARERARALASQLGVRAVNVSLAARYPQIDWAAERSILGFGVALTVSDESSAPWHRLAAPTPMPTRYPIPISSPRPVPMPTAALTRGPGPPATPPDVVPIDVPDPATLIISEASVQKTFAADELRLSVSIARGDKTPDDSRLKALPDSAALEHQLRASPDVVDVAVQETRNDPLPIGYQLIVRTWDRRRVQTLLATITSRYARFHVATRFDTSPVLSDCREQVLRAQQASIDQAEDGAVLVADSQKRRLRRLILAAAYPPVTGDFCAVGALPDAVDRARNDTLILPESRLVELRVPVKLTFRTYSLP